MLIHKYTKQSKEGSELFLRLTKTIEQPKGVLCLVHGQGDYSGCFEYLTEYFTQASFHVLAIDLHGNGNSPGVRGHIDDYNILLDDIDLLLSQAKELFPTLPIFLYGHSLGGNLVINYVLSRKPDITGVISSSPWLSLTKHPILRWIHAYLLDKIKPNYIIDLGLDASAITRDPVYTKTYIEDPLIHGKISMHLLESASRRGSWALHHANEFDLPLLLQHGVEDSITSAKAARKFYKNANTNKVILKIWNGRLHSLHNEINRDEMFHYVQNFLLEHIK